MTDSVKKRAYAKVNLYLEVKGKIDGDRAGRHEIESLMQSINLYDDVTLTKRKDEFLLSDFPGDNALVLLERLQHIFHTSGCTVTTEKHVPIGGGLGGSSMSAAAAALAFAELWGITDTAKIAFIASNSFADAAFQMTGGTAIVRGYGNGVDRLPPLPPYSVLLAFPSEGVSTAEAYRLADEMSPLSKGNLPAMIEALSHGKCAQAYYRNDLLAPAIRLNGEILPLLEKLYDDKALLTGMSGSGSTLFSLYLDREAAERKARHLNCRAVVTETISRFH